MLFSTFNCQAPLAELCL